MANAIVTWAVARATGGRVVLRIEDHDRQRCRPAYEAALLDDLEALGFVPDEPPLDVFRSGATTSHRQSDNGPAYEAAVAVLDAGRLVYGCDCSRSTFLDWAAARGRPWAGSGCPGLCLARGLARDEAGVTWRVALGSRSEAWTDLVLGSQSGPVATGGDLMIRDRHGNWTYALCVVVDDLGQDIDLVVRGEDLIAATPAQVRLGRLLGRAVPPRFLHHPLIRRPDGRKLSKADGATAVRELLGQGVTSTAIRERASIALGLVAPVGA